MKQVLVAGIVISLGSLPVAAALKGGDWAPKFTAQASLNGKTFQYSLQDALKKGPVVVYFFPSAYTSGCNLQAHTFSVNTSKFRAAGASIVGVSLDGIDRLNDFSKDPNYCAGQFPTASDPDGMIAKSFGLQISQAPSGTLDTRGIEISHAFSERTTFVVMTNGRIVVTIGGTTPKDNVDKALQAVRRLPKTPD
jgi:peroxiredoxin